MVTLIKITKASLKYSFWHNKSKAVITSNGDILCLLYNRRHLYGTLFS